MELKRDEIVKALAMFIEDMPVELHLGLSRTTRFRLLLRDALSLIKELTEEVASWKAIAEGYQKQFEDCAEDRAKLTEENERLRAERDVRDITIKDLYSRNKELQKANEDLGKRCIELTTELIQYTESKADTVRKMQSEIEARCIKGGIYPAFVKSTIDQIAKEMLGETNG